MAALRRTLTDVQVVMRGVTAPHTDDEHGVELCVTVQVAPLLLESLLTVAVNGVPFSAVIAFTGMIALTGRTVTVIAGTVISIKPCWLGSESEVATISKTKSLAGGLAGAV